MRVQPDDRVTQAKVQIGRIAGDRVEVLSGIDAGARVVASGGSFLNEGDVVRVTSGTAPATAAAGASGAKR